MFDAASRICQENLLLQGHWPGIISEASTWTVKEHREPEPVKPDRISTITLIYLDWSKLPVRLTCRVSLPPACLTGLSGIETFARQDSVAAVQFWGPSLITGSSDGQVFRGGWGDWEDRVLRHWYPSLDHMRGRKRDRLNASNGHCSAQEHPFW